ncbi:MAG: dehalogenase [Candidatus Glassbacteria bacterium]|nr:dehalogenase [Candidatus Glassbacteria bacterium]
MEFFNSGIFWLIEGVLLCLAFIGFKAWLADRGHSPGLWQWGLVLVWTVMFGFTVSFVFTSLGEKETEAALKGGLLFGLITVICGAGFWRLLHSSGGKDERQEVE